jgi:hypothetical protein
MNRLWLSNKYVALNYASYAYFLAITLGITLSATSLIWSNAYWLDELNSVTSSALPLDGALSIWVTETGPPLYRLILSLWMNLFSDDEIATRALSFLCVTAAIFSLFILLKPYGKNTQFIAATLLASNGLIIYAANEVRPYALVLLLTTLCTCWSLAPINSIGRLFRLMVGCLLLSLTHYIGLVYSGLLLLMVLMQYRRNYFYVCLILASMSLLLIWPIYQALHGGLLNKAGGNFWIQVSGPIDTLQIYFSGLIPIESRRIRILITAVGFLIVSILMLKPVITLISKGLPNTTITPIFQLSRLVFTFLLVAIIFDLHSPISTPRNSIILIPALCVLVALLFSTLQVRRPKLQPAIFTCLITIIFINLQTAYRSINEKLIPLQNWPAAAQFVIDHHTNESIYCFGGDDYTRISNFYLKKLSNNRLTATSIKQPIDSISGPAFILYGNYGNDPSYQWLKNKALQKDGVVDYIPMQHYGNGAEAGVFVLK